MAAGPEQKPPVEGQDGRSLIQERLDEQLKQFTQHRLQATLFHLGDSLLGAQSLGEAGR